MLESVGRPNDGWPISESEWKSIGLSLGLSERELEVVCGIWKGQADADTAATLGVSPRTVHTYVERVYTKLGVHNRIQLVVAILTAARALAET